MAAKKKSKRKKYPIADVYFMGVAVVFAAAIFTVAMAISFLMF